MRIALVHMRHAPTGGTERYLDLLAAFLAERGHDVTIVCRSHAAAPHPAVRFRVLHPLALGKSWRMWSFAVAVERLLRRERFDLVYGLGRTWSQDVVRLGGGLHATYLAQAHAASLSGIERPFRGGLKHPLALRIEARALAKGAYRRIVTNSDMVRRDLLAHYDVRADDVVTIHNGADLERFHPELRHSIGRQLRAAWGFDADELVVLFLGTGYGRKGLDLLLDAFPELARICPEARLVVVGYDSGHRRFRRRATANGIAERVQFLGGRRDAEACYAAADLYALPTRYDAFANSTVEALASGLPVVTTSSNGGAELIAPHVEGSVFDVADGADALAAELRYWADPELRSAAAAAARARAETCGARTQLIRTEELLLEVAAERTP